MQKSIKKIDVDYIILLVFSFVMKLFNSLASPIFPNNSFQADNNVFYSIGKALVNGKVLYSDVIDNKTPYIYFINSLARIISANHIGLYIIESLFLYFTLYYIYKIIKSYIGDSKVSLIGSGIFAVIVNISYYTLGMSKTEVYTMPFILGGFYLAYNTLIGANNSKKRTVINNDFFVISLYSGLAFMFNVKHFITFTAIYVVLIIYMLVNKNIDMLKSLIVSFFAGIAVAILPYLIYVCVTGSFSDAIYGIFVLPAQYIGSGASLYHNGGNIFDSIIYFISNEVILFVFLIISLILLFVMEKKLFVKIMILCAFFVTLFHSSIANVPYRYYYISFFPFLIPIIVSVCAGIVILTRNVKVLNTKFVQIACLVVLFLISLAVGFSDVSRQYPAITHCNEKLKESVKKYIGNTENVKVLAVGFIPEVYVALDNIIAFPCFITMNNRYNAAKEFVDAQTSYVVNGEATIVVVNARDSYASFSAEKKDELEKALTEKYVLADSIDTKTTNGTYEIYKLEEINP